MSFKVYVYMYIYICIYIYSLIDWYWAPLGSCLNLQAASGKRRDRRSAVGTSRSLWTSSSNASRCFLQSPGLRISDVGLDLQPPCRAFFDFFNVTAAPASTTLGVQVHR